MKCRNCGKEVKENWKVCPWCKASLVQVTLKCPNCGEEVDESWDVCPVCEYPLHVDNNSKSTIVKDEEVLPSIDDILPTDSDLDLVSGDILEAKQRQNKKQNAEYQKKLNLARISCIRKNYEKANDIYEELIAENPEDLNAYIGLVRIETQNYTLYQGEAIDEAIRVVKQIGIGEKILDVEYKAYLEKRKSELAKIAEKEAKKKKQEVERKAKLEAERKAKEEAERKAKAEAERKAKEEVERKNKAEAERKAKEEAKRKAKEEADRKAKEEAMRKQKVIDKKILRNFDIQNGVLVKYLGKGGDVIIPDCVTSIGEEAFRRRPSIKSVTIPSSVTCIGNSAFRACNGLKSVIIPEGVIIIENSAFRGCSALTSVTIPDSVKNIKSGTFRDCTLLRKASVSKKCKISSIAFDYSCEVIRRY